jgi:hypothetical protein
MTRRYHQVSDKSATTIDVSAPEGSYRPAARALILEAWAAQEPQSVSASFGDAENVTLTQVKPAALSTSLSGWSYEDGLLRVKCSDHFAPERFKILY